MSYAILTGIGSTPQRQSFIEQYYPLAVKVTSGTNIFPEVLITQAIVESQGLVNGSWYPGESLLTKLANNYFGIKGVGDMGSITLQTGEFYEGQYVNEPGTFAKYSDIEASFEDYVDFLYRNPRYTENGVFDADTPQEQFEALQRAGYATNPQYANILYQVYLPFKNLMQTIYNSTPKYVINAGAIGLGLFGLYLIYKYANKK